MAKLKVTKVENQGDRLLIYGHPKYADYHVIASVKEKIKEGDEIEYEADGWNFGWFISKVGENFTAKQG